MLASVEQRLDLLLEGVGELVPVAVEELDAVVLRRVVRGGDHDAQVEREQGDRRRRQDSGENGVAACGNDTARERLLELRPGAARVAADEDAAAAGPERRSLAELLDELGGQVLAEDPPDSVGAEEPPHKGVSASRTAGLCGPCAVRPSCARPGGRRASGSPRA